MREARRSDGYIGWGLRTGGCRKCKDTSHHVVIDSDKIADADCFTSMCLEFRWFHIFIDVLKLLLRGLCRFFPGFDSLWQFVTQEFFEGCLQFRGQARAIEVGKVLQDQQWLIRTPSKTFHPTGRPKKTYKIWRKRESDDNNESPQKMAAQLMNVHLHGIWLNRHVLLQT